MKQFSNRRDVLRGAAAAAAGLSLPRMAFAQAAGGRITATRLADDLLMFSGAGSNVVIAQTGDGLVMVDGGLADHSAALLKAVEAAAPGPIRTLFNTHWHWDHTGSNETLGKAGVTIMAHENTRLWMTTDINVKWQDRVYPPVPEVARPNKTFYTGGRLDLGGRKIDYGHLFQAHTDGDVYVVFPEENVIAVGDLLSVGRYPIMDYSTGGWIGGLIDANKALVEMTDDDTRLIPGKGPVQGRADLIAQMEMLEVVRDRVAETYRAGQSLEEFRAKKPTAEFDAKWGDPDLFLHLAYEGAWGHVRELGRII